MSRVILWWFSSWRLQSKFSFFPFSTSLHFFSFAKQSTISFDGAQLDQSDVEPSQLAEGVRSSKELATDRKVKFLLYSTTTITYHQQLVKNKLAKLRRCASRVSFRSKSLGPINQHQWPCRPPYLPPCRPPCPTPCQPIFCRSSCRPPCGTTCWPIFFVVCHIVHLHTDVHLHVSHHGGHHNVVSTHCEVSETVTEWKSESVTKDACASKNTQSCTDLLID